MGVDKREEFEEQLLGQVHKPVGEQRDRRNTRSVWSEVFGC
jgi:hypothetical protein